MQVKCKTGVVLEMVAYLGFSAPIFDLSLPQKDELNANTQNPHWPLVSRLIVSACVLRLLLLLVLAAFQDIRLPFHSSNLTFDFQPTTSKFHRS